MTVDTSLKERQWRDLSRLDRSLRYCSPATFEVLLLRALNERNWQAPARVDSRDRVSVLLRWFPLQQVARRREHA